MKCFNHLGADAVGTCKSCYRGLCPDCAELVNRSLACKDECVADVQALDDILKRSRSTLKTAGSAYKRNAGFFFASGLVFLVVGALDESWLMIRFLLPLGIVFLVGGLYQLKTAGEINKKTTSSSSSDRT